MVGIDASAVLQHDAQLDMDDKRYNQFFFSIIKIVLF